MAQTKREGVNFLLRVAFPSLRRGGGRDQEGEKKGVKRTRKKKMVFAPTHSKKNPPKPIFLFSFPFRKRAENDKNGWLKCVVLSILNTWGQKGSTAERTRANAGGKESRMMTRKKTFFWGAKIFSSFCEKRDGKDPS